VAYSLLFFIGGACKTLKNAMILQKVSKKNLIKFNKNKYLHYYMLFLTDEKVNFD
jgi:hypothetical protein